MGGADQQAPAALGHVDDEVAPLVLGQADPLLQHLALDLLGQGHDRRAVGRHACRVLAPDPGHVGSAGIAQGDPLHVAQVRVGVEGHMVAAKDGADPAVVVAEAVALAVRAVAAAGVVGHFVAEGGGGVDVVDRVAPRHVGPANGGVDAWGAHDEAGHQVGAVLAHAIAEQRRQLGEGVGGDGVVVRDHLGAHQAYAYPFDLGLLQGAVDQGHLGQGIGLVVADVLGGFLGEAGQQVDHDLPGLATVHQQAALATFLEDAGHLFKHLLDVVDLARVEGVRGVEAGQHLLAVGRATDDGVGLGQQGDEAAVVPRSEEELTRAREAASRPQGLADVHVEPGLMLDGFGAGAQQAQACLLAQLLGAQGGDTAARRARLEGLQVDELAGEGDFPRGAGVVGGGGVGRSGCCHRQGRQGAQ